MPSFILISAYSQVCNSLTLQTSALFLRRFLFLYHPSCYLPNRRIHSSFRDCLKVQAHFPLRLHSPSAPVRCVFPTDQHHLSPQLDSMPGHSSWRARPSHPFVHVHNPSHPQQCVLRKYWSGHSTDPRRLGTREDLCAQFKNQEL